MGESMTHTRLGSPFLLCLTLVACSGPAYGTGEVAGGGQAQPLPQVATQDHPRSRPHFVHAGKGPADAAIREAVAAAGDERVVVYIGASWCGPCTAFHKALDAGELDKRLAGVRFVEFDWDLDQARLVAAGYGGRLIPRFALPNPDGSFSGRKIEGGIKGGTAVEHIMGRLEPLLAEE